ncbi:hypothetical protein [Actinoallomurus acaciae]|uniref:Uncharacterized protein n=1 Tax=Actinoallomurus acaciae TaxID=502577 RepID=A0ABV5YGR1_9ACTN
MSHGGGFSGGHHGGFSGGHHHGGVGGHHHHGGDGNPVPGVPLAGVNGGRRREVPPAVGVVAVLVLIGLAILIAYAG